MNGSTIRTAVADGLTIQGYDLFDIFDCVTCRDTGLDPDCWGHPLDGDRVVVCGCPDCGAPDQIRRRGHADTA